MPRDRATLAGYRRQRRWTQAQLAQYLGSTQGHISEYETGARAPSLPTLCRLAAILNVSLEELAKAVFTPGD